MGTRLSVITVTYNSERHIAEQIRSVALACRTFPYEHIVVDNASDDRTVDIVRHCRGVTLIENAENVGFGKANNLGFKQSTGEYILLLNPDMKQITDLAQAIKKLESDDKIGILGARLLNPSGDLNARSTPRRFPRLLDQLAILTKMAKIFPKLLSRYIMNDVSFVDEMDVDSVQGSWMLLDRKMIAELGGLFDERFYIWFEDVDLCRRAHEAGYQVVWDPRQQAIDIGGQSFIGRSLFYKQWQFVRSMGTYFMKWGP